MSKETPQLHPEAAMGFDSITNPLSIRVSFQAKMLPFKYL
jgi:hypothetical protein